MESVFVSANKLELAPITLRALRRESDISEVLLIKLRPTFVWASMNTVAATVPNACLETHASVVKAWIVGDVNFRQFDAQNIAAPVWGIDRITLGSWRLVLLRWRLNYPHDGRANLAVSGIIRDDHSASVAVVICLMVTEWLSCGRRFRALLHTLRS